jgi:hypothetical protein
MNSRNRRPVVSVLALSSWETRKNLAFGGRKVLISSGCWVHIEAAPHKRKFCLMRTGPLQVRMFAACVLCDIMMHPIGCERAPEILDWVCFTRK